MCRISHSPARSFDGPSGECEMRNATHTAQPTLPLMQASPQHAFTLLDALVLLAYLGGTTALGMWVGRRQKDAQDYFVADRAIPWWAVLFSIVASETSALTFISIPGL